MKTGHSLLTILPGLGFMSCGNALVNILIPLKAIELGFSDGQIGWMVSFYYLGFLLGCLYTPVLVRRAGHIRSFILTATILGTMTLSYSQVFFPYLWVVFRAFSGFCIAGIYMIAESWVNDVADDDRRSRTISYYRVVDLSAVVCGQLLVGVIVVESTSALVYANIIMSFGVVPLALTTSREPTPMAETRVSVGSVFRKARTAALGSIVGGMVWGAFLGIGPVFAQKMQFSGSMIGFFVSFAIVAGIGFQTLVGLVADKIDNEKLLAMLGFFAGITALAIWWIDQHSLYLVLFVGLWGGLTTPIYSLSIAIGNRLRGDSSFLEVSGSLLLIYGAGAIIGPKFAVVMMGALGPAGLFVFIGSALLALTVAVPIFRLVENRSRPILAGDDYVAAPRRTPAIYEIDPRSSDDNRP